MAGWLGVLVEVLLKILKGIFGTDRPRKTTVVKSRDSEVNDGKTDADRLRDCGL